MFTLTELDNVIRSVGVTTVTKAVRRGIAGC